MGCFYEGHDSKIADHPKGGVERVFRGVGVPFVEDKECDFRQGYPVDGAGPEVLDGRPDHLERLLAIYLGEAIGARCVVSIGAISVTAFLSVGLRNGVLLGEVEEISWSGSKWRLCEKIVTSSRSSSP